MNQRFWVGYTATFSLIWIAFGLFSVIKGAPSSGLVLAFSIAFVVVLSGSTRLSRRLMSYYRQLDSKRKTMLGRRGN